MTATVPWMSGLVNGLQNRLRRFESARHLKSKVNRKRVHTTLFFYIIKYRTSHIASTRTLSTNPQKKMCGLFSRALKNLSNSKPNNKNSGAAPPLCCDPAFIRNFRKNLKNSPNNASQTYIWPHLTAFRVFLRHFRLICLHS